MGIKETSIELKNECDECENYLNGKHTSNCGDCYVIHHRKSNYKSRNPDLTTLKPAVTGELAIFWDDEKRFAVIGEYLKSMGESTFTFFKHIRLGGVQYVNAIPFESIEQYREFIKS